MSNNVWEMGMIKELEKALELLREARKWHGAILMSEPPQDGWKYYRISERIDAFLASQKAGQRHEQAEQCEHGENIRSDGVCIECGEKVRGAFGEIGADGWRRVNKPAMVGAVRFGVGISSRLVVEAAQRQYEYSQEPAVEAERIERIRDFVASVREERPEQAEGAQGDMKPCPFCGEPAEERADEPGGRGWFACSNNECPCWHLQAEAHDWNNRATLAQPYPAVVQLSGSRERRVYIAGPMTGYKDFNFPAFNAQAEALRGLGYHVENPAEHGIVHGAEWQDYLRYDIGRLSTCEAIFLLPGWSKSKGAALEAHIAKALGMTFIHHADAEHDQTSPAPELERPEVVGYRYCSSKDYPSVEKWHYQESFPSLDNRKVREIGGLDKLMTVAQHERIVGALRDAYDCNTAIMHARTGTLERVTQERDAALSRVAELEEHCKRLGQGDAERYWENRWREDSARLAELEQQEPVAFRVPISGNYQFFRTREEAEAERADYLRGVGETTNEYPPESLYTRPVPAAQAGQVPECFRLLLKHAHGMTMGVDWNHGTAAGHHRESLGEAVVQCQAWLAAAPQPANGVDHE